MTTSPNPRVAVVGCSHSAYDQVFFSKDNNGLDWVHHMSIDNPHIEFHNYSEQGHGPLYYDFVLKYILANFPQGYYDAVILQYTVESRWLIPVTDVVASELIPFHTTQISDNYILKRFQPPRIVATHGSAHSRSFNESTPDIKITLETLINKYHDKNGLPIMYENAFMSTVDKIYGPHFNNLFYFDFLNGYKTQLANTDNPNITRSNIDMVPFIVWASTEYGEEHLVMKLLDSSLHCSAAGNELLYSKYILASAIGKYLK